MMHEVADDASDEEGGLMLHERASSAPVAAWAPAQPHVFSAALVNTLKATLGTGLLAMPWAFAQAGAYSLPLAIGSRRVTTTPVGRVPSWSATREGGSARSSFASAKF